MSFDCYTRSKIKNSGKLDLPLFTNRLLFCVQNLSPFRYFYLEFCQGTLKKYCTERNEWPRVEQIDGLLQMADGLRYIHEKQLVHRDIKPENILFVVEPSNRTVTFKISDFGLVKETTENGSFSVSSFRGTVYYMAPEFLEYHEQRSTNSTNFFRGSQAADVFRLW